jgi:hypothetical protein
MPKIEIKEIDNTGIVSESAILNTVYIPGPYADGGEAKKPTLFVTSKALLDKKDDYDADSLSFKLAVHLLELGIYVLYEGIAAEPTDSDWEAIWENLTDKTLYDVRFLTTGQYTAPSKNMIKCAAKRGDCIALLDHPEDETTIKEEDLIEDADITVVKKVRNYFEQYKDDGIAGTIDAGSYVSCMTPWFKTKNATLLGDSEEKEIGIPASFGYLFAYANSIVTYPEWYAVAGSFRGIIKELTDVYYDYSSSEIEILQARGADGEVDLDDLGDNEGCAINPIALVRPFGYIVWGNRTFRENDGTTVATSFLNVRNLVSAIKKALYNAARKYTFEQNSEILWINFQSQVTPLLDRMKSGNGILGYRFTKLKTDKKARLKARLTIVPIEAVEDFQLEVELADSLEVVE